MKITNNEILSFNQLTMTSTKVIQIDFFMEVLKTFFFFIAMYQIGLKMQQIQK